MTIEAEMWNQGFSFVGSGLGGYFAGWGLGKVIKLALKIVAGAVGVFFGIIAYLQSQGFMTVNWDKFQTVSDNLVNTAVNSTVISGSDGGIYHVVANLGIPMSLGIGMGFMLGITKGLRG